MNYFMKNLAGNDVSIFLFRFVLQNNGISFVLNESIAEDMYPEIDEQMQPLVHACGETLLRYRAMCRGETIMDGNILVDGCFEVMLSKGIGRHFVESEKQYLFHDAHEIANLLMKVMERRTEEEKLGTYPGPQPVVHKIRRTESTNDGLEALGKKRHLLDEMQFETNQHKSSLSRLKPDDLPCGVVARRGYDHRGHCMAFEHETLGELGKIILIDSEDDEFMMKAELSKVDAATFGERQKMLEEIVTNIEVRLREN